MVERKKSKTLEKKKVEQMSDESFKNEKKEKSV
jgi:hypothetical protein